MLSIRTKRPPRSAGLALALLAQAVATMPSLVATAALYLPGRAAWAPVLLATWLWLALAGLCLAGWLPGLAARSLARRLRIAPAGTAWWLPGALVLGEATRHATARLSLDWIFSQWQVDAVLRAVAVLGPTATTFACVTLVACVADAVMLRSRGRAVTAPVDDAAA